MFKNKFMEADAPNSENFRYSPLTASEKYHLKSGNLSHMSPQEYIEDSQSAISQARVEAGLGRAASTLNQFAPPNERLAFINPAEEAMLKEMGGSGEPAAGGIPSFKKGDVEAPPPRNYGQETRDTLQAQVDLAPQLFASESQFRPQYAYLERRMILEQMGIDPSKGLLKAYEEDFAPSMVRQKAATVKGDIDMLREYGPELLAAQRAADPLADSLRQGIMDTAAEDLAAGMGLTETEQRDLDQQVLSGAADRGMEGQASTFGDMIGQRLSANRAIKQQRLANAANAYQLGASDPLFALTGRAATTPNQAMAQFGSGNFALDSSPGLFNPESQYAGNLATQNFQGQMDARTATAANRAGMFSGLIGGLGSAAGGIFSGGFAKGGAFT